MTWGPLPCCFKAQTRWIADNYRKRNIAYVWHLGDITQDDEPAQWEVAKSCFDMIEGKVPYLLVPGNHDYSGDALRRSRLSEYFPIDKMKQWPTFGGAFDDKKLDNSYHLFRIGDQDWIALGLEFGPRQEVVEWADRILDQHADRCVAVVTHAYLFRDNQRYDYAKGSQRASPHGFAGDGNDGEELWQKLIRKHKNVMVVISGHVRTGGPTGSYLASEDDHGNIVHQMMTSMKAVQRIPTRWTLKQRTGQSTRGSLLNWRKAAFPLGLEVVTADCPSRAKALVLCTRRLREILRSQVAFRIWP